MAIELAAGQANILSIQAIVRQLSESISALLADYADLPARHHSINALFDMSWRALSQPGRRTLTDIVLGDRFGSSADPRLMARIERSFRAQGFTVARNAPYGGGYTNRRYGRPRRGIHALQVEINRGLYMDEQRITRASGYGALKDALQQVMAEIIEAARFLPRA